MTAPFNPAAISAVLIGDQSLTIACGDLLIAGGHKVEAVVTQSSEVEAWAQQAHVAVLAHPADLIKAACAPDWLLSIANLRVIPEPVLELAREGAINFHDGPLPAAAGLNTPAWAIINQEQSHGVTWHMMAAGLDEGDIIATQEIEIAPDETAFSLNSKCYAAGVESFAQVLGQLETGTLQRRPQDLSLRRYFAKQDRPEDLGLIDFDQPARAISALVRGLSFGAYANPLALPKMAVSAAEVWAVGEVEHAPGKGAPGSVIAQDEEGLTVATRDAALRLTKLRGMDGQPADLSDVSLGDALPRLEAPVVDLKREGPLRKLLAQGMPLSSWLIRDTGRDRDMQRRELPLPEGLTPKRAAAALALLLNGHAEGAGAYVALHRPLDHPMLATWRPVALPLMPTEDFGESLAELERAMDRDQQAPGMAADLALRDPDIPKALAPDVAISFSEDACSKAALTLCVTAEGVWMHFDAARLSPSAADLLVGRAAHGLNALKTAKSLAELTAMPPQEAALQVETWNKTERVYPTQTIQAAFEAQVARTADAEALVFENQVVSYAGLNTRANRLAHRLRAAGAEPGVPIGIYANRSIDLVVAALGILKAGAAYVPLDPSYPADRIAHYIADSGAPIIVTQPELKGQLRDQPGQIFFIEDAESQGSTPDDNPAPTATATDLAYLIYTSGSTGKPKGVMVSHDNVANFFAGMDDRIAHQPGAVWLAVTSLSFDISVLELFWTLSRGFKVVLAGDESRTQIANGRIAAHDRQLDFNFFYWGNDDGVGAKKYELLLEGAKFADANGFNAVWTPERHFHAFGGPYPNPSVTGAAVAAVTRNIAVRAGSCVAPLHHPARIAEEWAVIDNLTNGRVGLAIASGWQPDDFVLRPENTPPANKPAMYAAIEQLRKLWRGEPVAFPKQDGTPLEVVTQPRPVSQRLPIWVTTAGNPQTWREAGEIGANVLTHLLGQSVSEVAEKIKIYHAALRASGHDPRDFTVTVMLHTYLAETRAAAEAVARAPMKDYLRSAAGLIKQYAWAFPAFKKPTGSTSALDIDLEALAPDEMEAILEFAFQRYFNDSGLFGTVADGVARAEELRRIGVDEIACLIDYGISGKEVLAGLTPLAEVLARVNMKPTLAADDFSIAAQILRHGVTHMQCTPSMAQMLVANSDAQMALGQLEHLFVGGEALPGSLVSALQSHFRGVLQNMYGPTETTIWSTSQTIEAAGPAAPIGTPIANTQCYVLDDAMNLQPVGAEGELWIGGAGVTPGYWKRPELTQELFVASPFGPGRLYRTGDLARWDAEGCLHFAGRADGQVKIRGHRIELGEIEARLSQIKNVSQAIVIERESTAGSQLVAYVTGDGLLSEAEMKTRLSMDLPAIMVPTAIVPLAAMPLTPNKKIDRKALPAPRAQKSASAVPLGTGPQAKIAAVWSALLGVPDVRPEDNFFALGGHSLLAVKAHRDIKEALGTEQLTITDIFRFPTLSGLAAHLSAEKPANASPSAGRADRSAVMSKRRAMRAGRRGAVE
ncbi:MAG: MupA/Atu3671 family FMN-dependent luciferase-like monooxygenase [Pseudomonadota bacterium]